MMLRSILAAALLFVSAGVFTASATPIAAFTGQVVTTSSRTELGRLSRNGIPQTWTGKEPYPGVVNPSTTYYYNTYTLNYQNFAPDTFLEISFTDTNGNNGLFISAYANSFDPTNRALNWLGDAGSSEYFNNSDAVTFQISLGYKVNVVFVVNNTGTGTGPTSGLNSPYDIFINGYTDTEYNDTDVTGIATPEPSTFIELGTGILAMAGVVRRRFLQSA